MSQCDMPFESDVLCHDSPVRVHVVHVFREGDRAECIFCGRGYEVEEGREDERNWLPEDTALNDAVTRGGMRPWERYYDVCFRSPSKTHEWEQSINDMTATCRHCGRKITGQEYLERMSRYRGVLLYGQEYPDPNGTSPYAQNPYSQAGGYYTTTVANNTQVWGGGGGGSITTTAGAIRNTGSTLTMKNLQAAVDSVEYY